MTRAMWVRSSVLRPARALLGVAAFVLAACQPFHVHRVDSVPIPAGETTLANGMVVRVAAEPTQTNTYVLLRFGVGAANDPSKKRGLAHFVEHLAFRRGDALVSVNGASEDAHQQTETGGFSLAEWNGQTDFEETVYWLAVPPAQLGASLHWLAGLMGDFTKSIDPEVFATEKDVVRSERRSRNESTPLARWLLDLFENFFPSNHPYAGAGAIGTHEAIAAFDIEDVRRFAKKHYHPANATLVIVGPVDEQAAINSAASAFGNLDRGSRSVLQYEPWSPRAREVDIDVPSALGTLVTVAWPIGPAGSSDCNAIKLLNLAVGETFSENLQGWHDWVRWVNSYVIEEPAESLFVVQAWVIQSYDIDVAKELVLQLSRDLWTGLNHRNLDAVRDRVGKDELYASEFPVSLAMLVAKDGRPDSWGQRFAAERAMEPSTIRDAAQRLLVPERAFVLIHTSKTKASAGKDYTASEARRTAEKVLDHADRRVKERLVAVAAKASEFAERSLAKLQRSGRTKIISLSNGLRVALAPKRRLPLTAISVLIPQLPEPSGKQGVGKVMLNSLTPRASDSWFDRYRMAMETYRSVQQGPLAYDVRFDSADADRALSILAEVLRTGGGVHTYQREAELRSAVAQVRFALEGSQTSANNVAWRALADTISPSGEPTLATVRRINFEDAKTYYLEAVQPQKLVVGVQTSLDDAEIVRLLQEYLGDWQPGSAAQEASTEHEPQERWPLVVVPWDRAQVSYLLFAFRAPEAAKAAAWVKTYAAVTLLTHRLRHIREAMGLTYDVATGLYPEQGRSVVWVAVSVSRAAQQQAHATVEQLLGEASSLPVTEGDLESLKRSLIGYYVEPSDSRSAAREAAERVLHGLPPDFNERAVQEAAHLDAETLQASLAQILAKRLAVVAVGEMPSEELVKSSSAKPRFAGVVTRSVEALISGE